MSGAPAEPLAGRVELLAPAQDSDFPAEWYELGSAEHFWFEWRLRALLAQVRSLGIPTGEPLLGLDVGAGAGVLRDQLEARAVWTIDIADLNLSALRQARAGRGRTLCYDVLAPRPELLGRYDLVLLFDVIEHVADTRPFVAAVLRHLRPGGHLLVNVPAGQWLFSAYDRAAGHFRRYDAERLRAEFAGASLEVRDVRYWGMTMLPLLLLRKLVVRGAASNDDCVRQGFAPPGRLADAWLRALMRLENALVEQPPRGSSLLLAGRRL